MSHIELNNITKSYTDSDVDTPALAGVSLSIVPGEFVAIMGPSGSGKSTLLHILGLLDSYTSGSYVLAGAPTNKYEGGQLAQLRNKKMGFVFQAFNLLPKTSVYDNVMLPLLYSAVPERLWNKKILNAIESVGLSHRTHYETGKLSGGEKQRTAIARALVMEPDIIFADEPTGNLDSKSGKAVMEYFQKFHESGRTIVLVTHETYTAHYAQRIIKLRDGRIESDELVTARHTIPEFTK